MKLDGDRSQGTGPDPLDHDQDAPPALPGETPVLTQTGLRQLLRERIGLSHSEARDVVEAFFDVMATEMAAGRSVRLSGFGNFDVQVKKARPGRNPRTGEGVEVPARHSVKFAPGGKLRQQIRAPMGAAPEETSSFSAPATPFMAMNPQPAGPDEQPASAEPSAEVP